MINLVNVEINTVSAIIILFIVLIVSIILVKKVSRSVFDPWLPISVNHSILLFIVSLLYISDQILLSDFLYWVAATFALFLPLITQKQIKREFKTFSFTFRKSRLASLLLLGYLLCGYQLVFDLIFISARGVPIFYEFGSNPQIYKGGFGIVKYIHDSVRIILPPIATYILFLSNRRAHFIFMLLCSFYPAIFFEWSKVGFITIAASYWICYFYFFGQTRSLRNVSRIALLLALISVIFMFSRVAAAGYANNAFEAILIRLIETADSVNMYYLLEANAEIPSNYSFIRYVFSAIAGFASIEVVSIGHVLLSGAGLPTTSGYGPSPPAQIIGNVFFGPLGIVYCFIAGLLLRYIRRLLDSRIENGKLFVLMLYILSPTLTGDLSLIFYYLFTSLFLAPPVFCAIFIVLCMRRSLYTQRTVLK